MSLQSTLSSLFLRRVLENNRGRAFVLNQAAEAEGSDEGRIFDELLQKVDDDKLRKMIRLHKEDEDRHAELFANAANNVGVAVPGLPSHLRLIERLDQALGGFFEQFTEGKRGVMDLYLLLQVIEERATTQFAIMEPEFRKIDPEAADMIAQIAEDEVRHLKYCKAISKKYAESEEVRLKTLQEFREVESRVFGEHSRANMLYCIEQGFVDLNPLETMFWQGLHRMGTRRKLAVATSFWTPPTPWQNFRERRMGAKAA